MGHDVWPATEEGQLQKTGSRVQVYRYAVLLAVPRVQPSSALGLRGGAGAA